MVLVRSRDLKTDSILYTTARSVPMMMGSCAGLAALIGTFDAAGKSITGSYAHAQPIKAAQYGAALEGEHAENAGAGEPGWREERERRRQRFFKVREQEDC